MRATDSIVDLLREHASRRGEETSFVFLANGETEHGRISFLQLERRVQAVANLLVQRGLRGERVALLFQPGLDFIAAFFGCLAAGAVAVPVSPPRHPDECNHATGIVHAAGAQLILADAATAAYLGTRLQRAWQCTVPLEVLAWLAEPQEVARRADAAPLHTPRADDVAFLQFTSGSTGDPKGVVVTHSNILANQRAIQTGFRHGADTVVLGWLPFYHDMGLVGVVMQPVYLGRPCILMPPPMFVQKPLRWLKAISRYGVTTSGGPNFGYELCLNAISDADLDACPDLDLRSWTLAFTGAEPVRASTLENFGKRFARIGFDARAFYPCYGLAEATLMLTGVERSRPRIDRLDAAALRQGRAIEAANGAAMSVVSCGRVWGDELVVVVDTVTRLPVPECTVGEIWASGPSVARGYWNHPQATAEQFEATSPAYPGRRFLRTGDLGFMRDGELFITGRLKELIIVNGRNYFPQDIEATVSGMHPAFRPIAAVFADDELDERRIVLLQAVYPNLANRIDWADVAQQVVRKVIEAHGLRLSEVFFTTSRLPVTTSGKIRRRACRDAWRAGLLDPAEGSAARREMENSKGVES
ncbi:MAG: fatty acyl-AMP ligase [Sulfurifustis sp.]